MAPVNMAPVNMAPVNMAPVNVADAHKPIGVDAVSTAAAEARTSAVAHARQLANESAIAAARAQAVATASAAALPRRIERAQPMPAARLEALMADSLVHVPTTLSDPLAATDPAARRTHADPASGGMEAAGAAQSSQPARIELRSLKPGATVWVPARHAAASVVANDPFSRVMHVAMGDGPTGGVLEVPYAELQPPPSLVASRDYGKTLSAAIAGLQSEVHDLARELERAPDAKILAAAAADDDDDGFAVAFPMSASMPLPTRSRYNAESANAPPTSNRRTRTPRSHRAPHHGRKAPTAAAASSNAPPSVRPTKRHGPSPAKPGAASSSGPRRARQESPTGRPARGGGGTSSAVV